MWIDLNCDLGEGFGAWSCADDDALLAVVTSANVACGFHAGDPSIMRRVCQGAVRNGVAVGAHVGYADLRGFGRRPVAVPPEELEADVLYQIGALQAVARGAGTLVSYVKPHGALYHAAAADPVVASAVVSAVAAAAPLASVVGMPGSRLESAAAQARLTYIGEGFADRAYAADGTLAPRGHPDAVVTDPSEVVRQALQLATQASVTTSDGATIPVQVRTICLHGDTDGSVQLARLVRAELTAAGVTVRAFSRREGI